MLAQQRRRQRLHYDVETPFDRWTLEDDQVPESRPHDQVAERLCHLLTHRMKQTGQHVCVGRNLAIRFDEDHPRAGVDPDVYVLDPPPPDSEELTSLRLWETGHFPPRLAVEIVSTSRPDKDYSESPDKYAACGAEELWVFDPKLAGRGRDGPHRLQLWRGGEDGFTRIYAGEGPFFSPTTGGWVFAVNEGHALAIADDEAGTAWWMTGEEAERAAKEAERAAKEDALRRVAELEARLAAAEKKA
jgi:Putative restriction endonuclease